MHLPIPLDVPRTHLPISRNHILQSTHRRISTKINLIQKNCHNRLNGTNEQTS